MQDSKQQISEEDTIALQAEDVAVNQEAFVAEEDDGGDIQISTAVIGQIVRTYVLGIDGVLRFKNQSLMDGMLDIFSKRSADRSLDIQLGDDGAVISLTLVLRFGVIIPDVAHQIQSIVREKVEALSGYRVSKVNVNIASLEAPEPVEESDGKSDENTEEVDEELKN